jgi:hypothetical protein
MYFQLWYQLVTKYTRRDLTISSDRILAISAIADRLQLFLNDEYCAGHWRSRLHKELLWRVSLSDGLKPRPSEYQAPSWSWASISGPVETSLFSGGMWDEPPEELWDDCFKILGCQIQLRSEKGSFNCTEVYQFGAVRSGTLVVVGKIQQAGLWYVRDDFFNIQHCQVRRIGLRSESAKHSSLLVRCDALRRSLPTNKTVSFQSFFYELFEFLI